MYSNQYKAEHYRNVIKNLQAAYAAFPEDEKIPKPNPLDPEAYHRYQNSPQTLAGAVESLIENLRSRIKHCLEEVQVDEFLNG